MVSKRCCGDHRLNRLPSPSPINHRSPLSVPLEAKLHKPDWNSVDLPPFEKNLYQEHPNTAQQPLAAVRDYRRANWVTITTVGVVPKPVLQLEEANFPKCVVDGVKGLYHGPPGPVEAQCWPVALSGKDLLAVTPASGPRKALAYLLPAIAHIRQQPTWRDGKGPMALVLAPARQLAEQIHQVATQLEPRTRVRSVCIAGGRPKGPQLEDLKTGYGICVATPSRLLHFLEDTEVNLLRCTYLVLDETDRMLRIGLGKDILAIIEHIRPDRQILVFAASWLSDVRAFALPLLRDYIEASFIAPAHCDSHRVECITHVCELNEKEDILMTLLQDFWKEERFKIVVIARASCTIDDLVAKIVGRGLGAVAFYGKKTREEREWILGAFGSGAARILLATPAATHDLILEGVHMVVNFDLAENSIEYRRRMGLAASSGESGAMHTLVSPKDSGHVKHLISFLREANLRIDPELIRMARNGISSRKVLRNCSSVKAIAGNSRSC
ncbi:hypothetical protein V5799_002681 [Amblyomma americanum]|uniref:RNA helicase n=1 Tax=Amblyomma americanum TaxID=6943 RepID=A0AAQ4DB48_AMBAM